MNIYEFITPSDPITFKAKNDKIAYICSILLGSGQAGCKRYDENGNEINLYTILLMCPEPDKEIQSELGMPVKKFINQNRKDIMESLESFAYGSIKDRFTYDEAIKAINDPAKQKEFKMKHENHNRTSMSKWVSSAWNLAEQLNQEPQP